MTLVLQIENYRVLEDGGPVQFTVPEKGAKVGRSASMDWTLPDQTRHISSHHFDILVQQGAYYLRDVSTNGTYIHATRERVNGFHQLRDGDRIQVGTYLITAVMQERTQIAGGDQTVFMAQPSQEVAPEPNPVPKPAPAPTPQPVPQPAPAPTPPEPRPTPPPPVPEPEPQPIPTPTPDPEPAPIPEPTPEPEPIPRPTPEPDQIPRPTPEPEPIPGPLSDPTPDPAPQEIPPPSAPQLPDPGPGEHTDNPFATQAPDNTPDTAPPQTTSESIPELLPEDALLPDDAELDLPGETEPDADTPKKRDYSRIFEEVPARSLQSPPKADKTGFDDPAPVQAPPSVQIPDLDFIDSDFAAPSIPPTGIPSSDADGEVTGQLSLPPHEFLALERAAQEKAARAARGEPDPVPDEAPETADADTGEDPTAILRAFCKGAGLEYEDDAPIEAEALAFALGQSARVTASEVKQMLDARASTKQFTRGGARTMRRATDSNPLKFMPDAEQALEVMYLAPREGYQAGPEALKEALTDLRLHQTALFAAIQPALLAMMQGLSPEEIEAESEGGLMGGGGGKSWERFKTRYAERTEGHDNGLLDVFLTHFAKAYGEVISGDDD